MNRLSLSLLGVTWGIRLQVPVSQCCVRVTFVLLNNESQNYKFKDHNCKSNEMGIPVREVADHLLRLKAEPLRHKGGKNPLLGLKGNLLGMKLGKAKREFILGVKGRLNVQLLL